jgi:hypothetical protein
MATHHFTLSDSVAILAACSLFSLVTILPGYALGWLLEVVRFRNRTLPFRLAISVPLSIAIGPIVSYLLGSWLSLSAVWVVYGMLCLYAVFRVARERIAILKTHLKVLGLVLMWLVIAVLMLVDIQIERRLYFSIIAFDYGVRSAFTSSIATWGLPAQTPFFFPGHPVALGYHYYWMIPCAMVQQIGGPLVSARQAFIAGTMWCGIGLICLVPLYLRLFSPKAAVDISRRTIIGISLLGVTGLDILPALLMVWLYRKGLVGGVSPSVEWWNNQIDGWLYNMLWEPHYLASLIACLTGFLIIWDVPRGSGTRCRIVSGIVAGLAFATSVGAAIYVAFVFAIFLAVWTLITIAKKWYEETAILALAGMVAAVASIPYLIRLRSPGTGGSLLQFTVRSFDLAQILLKLVGLDHQWQSVLANIVFLPANYFLELGFFLAAAVLVWRGFRRQKRSPTRAELAAFTMAGTSVVVCTFLRSGVIDNNALGWRGFLIAQFVLLIWAADLLSMPAAIPRGDKAVLMAMLVLGAAGVVYDLAIVRFYPMLSDAERAPKIFWLAQDEKLGRRTYANREAYEWLRASTFPRTIIQYNPIVAYHDIFYVLYADRQVVAEKAGCEWEDPRECAPILERLAELFSNPAAASPESVCQSLSIAILVAKDTDAVWSDRSSWVWSRSPIFANDFVRLFSCSSREASAGIRR